MAKAMEIIVKETVKELKQLQKEYPGKYAIIQMLILIKDGKQKTKDGLAQVLGVSNKSVHIWRTTYKAKGIEDLLKENRGGKKPAQITEKIASVIEKRLSNPKEGFRSYTEAQTWLNDTFGLTMEYQAVNKFFKRRFKTKLKVARKSHIHKDPAAEAVFKKPG
jgi:transposase